jgi:hypothetical protein
MTQGKVWVTSISSEDLAVFALMQLHAITYVYFMIVMTNILLSLCLPLSRSLYVLITT